MVNGGRRAERRRPGMVDGGLRHQMTGRRRLGVDNGRRGVERHQLTG